VARHERYTIPADGYVRAAGHGDRSRAVDVEQFLAALRPAWHRYALCKTPAAAGVNFFPGRGESAEPAKAVCTECTAQPACLAWALAQDQRTLMGVWGGTSQRERQRRGSRSEPDADAA
jgi:WhiB family redox-sensing transcriptional regulator